MAAQDIPFQCVSFDYIAAMLQFPKRSPVRAHLLIPEQRLDTVPVLEEGH
jgi:hypothetical protein